MYQTIIDSWEVAQLCDSGAKVVILDCRFNLMDVEQGRALFLQGAVPKAQYVDLNRQLSSEVRPDSGRHPLPSRESALALFSALGIDSSVQVVVYDDCSGAMAARAWWLLQWLGHRACAVLDGGIQAWQGDGFELVPGSIAEVAVASFSAAPSAFVALSTEDILSERYQLVDARAAARFQGEQEPIDPVAGHVPGAQNWPFQQNLDGDGRLKSPAALAELLAPFDCEDVAQMCGSGVTACHNILAMCHAGFTPSKLYVGSWSEWIVDAARPVARGE